jgi:hypothetical protein
MKTDNSAGKKISEGNTLPERSSHEYAELAGELTIPGIKPLLRYPPGQGPLYRGLGHWK